MAFMFLGISVYHVLALSDAAQLSEDGFYRGTKEHIHPAEC